MRNKGKIIQCEFWDKNQYLYYSYGDAEIKFIGFGSKHGDSKFVLGDFACKWRVIEPKKVKSK